MEKITPDTAASPTKLSSINNKYMDIKNMYKSLKKGVVGNFDDHYFSIHHLFLISSDIYRDTNITTI